MPLLDFRLTHPSPFSCTAIMDRSKKAFHKLITRHEQNFQKFGLAGSRNFGKKFGSDQISTIRTLISQIALNIVFNPACEFLSGAALHPPLAGPDAVFCNKPQTVWICNEPNFF